MCTLEEHDFIIRKDIKPYLPLCLQRALNFKMPCVPYVSKVQITHIFQTKY